MSHSLTLRTLIWNLKSHSITNGPCITSPIPFLLVTLGSYIFKVAISIYILIPTLSRLSVLSDTLFSLCYLRLLEMGGTQAEETQAATALTATSASNVPLEVDVSLMALPFRTLLILSNSQDTLNETDSVDDGDSLYATVRAL